MVVARDIILIAGLWLPGSVWDAVCGHLTAAGHRPLAVSLPGVDDTAEAASLDDQLAAVLAAVDAADRPIVVGHSAAATLAWMAADRRAEAVAAVVMIGGFPAVDGATYAAFFDIVDGAMPFPGWDPFEGPDSADLDADARNALAAATTPVPAGVARGVVHLADSRRFDVPVMLVCPEFDPGQAEGWIAAGDVPELAHVTQLSLVDIDSGHWPMVTQPAVLARLIAAAVEG